jgi:hypothetical protein
VDNPALCHANVLEQPEGSPVSDPEVLGRVRALGGDVFAGDAASFIKAQQQLWGRVIREKGIARE